jgi:hypothetical protein
MRGIGYQCIEGKGASNVVYTMTMMNETDGKSDFYNQNK